MTPFQHYQLLLRKDRSLHLRDLIERNIKPGMRVLDAGCGSGLLSVWAAQRGANVVAVDRAPIELGKSLAAENGVEDRVQFIRGDLREVILGERFDALIAMVYMNDPRRDAGAHDLVYQLRRDNLRSGDGVMIPDNVRYSIMALEWPDQALEKRTKDLHEGIQALEKDFALGFSSLKNAILDVPCKDQFPNRLPTGRLEREHARELSAETHWFTVDYSADDWRFPSTLSVTGSTDGRIDALLFIQELRLGEEVIFRNESVSWLHKAQLIAANTAWSLAFDLPVWLRSNILRPGNSPV